MAGSCAVGCHPLSTLSMRRRYTDYLVPNFRSILPSSSSFFAPTIFSLILPLIFHSQHHKLKLTYQGTVLVADNVVKPGNPAYLSYVRSTPKLKREILASPPLTSQPPVTPNPTNEGDWDQAFKNGPIAETRWAPDEAEGIQADGDPGLVYTSKMLDGWDPYTGERDACEVSVCTGRED